MNTGYIHSIETLGTVDNGGIRFVLFLQGCALRCSFCHNPDTWLMKGKRVTVEEIIEQLQDYKSFFDLSGGGITVSGGEPLLQPEFVRDIFAQAGELGIHRALDTSGFCRHGNILTVLPQTDLMIFSIKVVDEEKHKKLTERDNKEILENLKLAVDSDVELVISYVLIPNVNDSAEDLQDLVHLVQSFARDISVQVLSYHKMGTVKWKEMGLPDPLADIPPAAPEDVKSFRKQLTAAGIQLH